MLRKCWNKTHLFTPPDQDPQSPSVTACCSPACSWRPRALPSPLSFVILNRCHCLPLHRRNGSHQIKCSQLPPHPQHSYLSTPLPCQCFSFGLSSRSHPLSPPQKMLPLFLPSSQITACLSTSSFPSARRRSTAITMPRPSLFPPQPNCQEEWSILSHPPHSSP